MLFLCCACYVNDQLNTNRMFFCALLIIKKHLIKCATASYLQIKAIGIDGKDFRIIRNLYYEQKAAIKLTEGLTEWTDIKRGVRQGCVMSPDLFNLYSEFILKELEEVKEGIQVNGRCINNIRYADDTVLLASSEAGLQMLVNIV